MASPFLGLNRIPPFANDRDVFTEDKSRTFKVQVLRDYLQSYCPLKFGNVSEMLINLDLNKPN